MGHTCASRHGLASELRPDGPCSCGQRHQQCKASCALYPNKGCLRKCCKVNATSFPFFPSRDFLTHRQTIDHDDPEHMCAARTHTCGAPCDLQLDGKPLCTRKCVADWQVFENSLKRCTDLAFSREEHQRHCCSLASSCPVKCQLCSNFCSAGDHFHALEADAVHLCG